MKIIFQDIDGPLIPARMYWGNRIPRDADGLWEWDPVAVRMLNALTNKHAAQIVFNSAHNDDGVDRLLAQATKNGLWNIHHSVRTTYPSTDRLHAINTWRTTYSNPDKWIAIDDERIQTPTLVHVNFNVGLTLDNYERADLLLKD